MADSRPVGTGPFQLRRSPGVLSIMRAYRRLRGRVWPSGLRPMYLWHLMGEHAGP